jgi:carbonic anhydrase
VSVSEMLTTRNEDFAARQYTAGLRMMPSLKTIVIGCVDPRVDPAVVLGAAPGEIAAIRNVGGRVTPAVRREVAMLRQVTLAAGGDLGPGWELIVMHHTDCGITRLTGQPELLSAFFEVDENSLAELAVTNPREAVALDVAALRAEASVPGISVSGLVYDVATGLIETIVKP